MRKESVLLVVIAILGLTLMIGTGCREGARVGDLQTVSQTIELGDADSVDVDIQMGAGVLDISGGSDELLEATFTYNVDELNPRASINGKKLVVRDSDVDEGIGSLLDLDKYRNEWDLHFNENVPMAMNIDLGAGRSNLALGALSLTSLNIDGGAGDVDLDLTGSQSLSQLDLDMGAGDTTIDLTGDWQNDLEVRINGGVGEFTLRLPSEVGVRVEVDTGIGTVEASGLARDGDNYTNDVYGVSDVTLRIDLQGGIGKINLLVE